MEGGAKARDENDNDDESFERNSGVKLLMTSRTRTRLSRRAAASGLGAISPFPLPLFSALLPSSFHCSLLLFRGQKNARNPDALFNACIIYFICIWILSGPVRDDADQWSALVSECVV